MNVFQSFKIQCVIYYFNIINLSKIVSVPRNIYVIRIYIKINCTHPREKGKTGEMDVRTRNSDTSALNIKWVRYRVNPNGIYSRPHWPLIPANNLYPLAAFYNNNIIHPILSYTDEYLIGQMSGWLFSTREDARSDVLGRFMCSWTLSPYICIPVHNSM